MARFNRRSFLRNSGALLLPTFVPASPLLASGAPAGGPTPPADRPVRFFGDGEMFSPGEYLAELAQVQAAAPIQRDNYGAGGAVEALEKKFAALTGKEKAILLPSGTMANTFALSLLSGDSAKVFVQETSHVYRDEADAIQSVFGKRLMPLAEGATCFTAAQLQAAIDKLKTDEYLPGGIGAVSIENPVRRTDGGLVPIGELRAISALCRARGIPLHLDGARLFMASAWSGVPVQEYAALFDTVYISLYKYLGAGAGAVLCGPKALIDKMPHLVKIHGGNQFSNWMNAAMALHRLEGFGERLRAAIAASETVFAALNKMPGIRVAPVPGGTNIYHLQLGKGVDVQRLRETLNKEHRIRLAPADASNRIALTVNETILYQTPEAIIAAFRKVLT